MGLTIYHSPALILIKLGVTLMLLAFSYLWTLQVSAARRGLIRQFGMTSLLVYWVHIELVYGRALWFFRENLSLPQTTLMAALIILAVLGLSVVRTSPAATKAFFRSCLSPPGPSHNRENT